MFEQDLETKKKKIKKIVIVIAVALFCFIFAPVIWIAVGGMVGLIVGGIIAFVAINFAPWFAEVIANQRLKALKAEYAKNPIESLQNEYLRRETNLKTFADQITEYRTEILNFADEYSEMKQSQKLPPEKLVKYETQLKNNERVIANREAKYKRADEALKQFADTVDQAKNEWKLAKSAEKMNKAAGITDEDFMAKLKVTTSLDSVRTSVNTSFAELETSLMVDGTPEDKQDVKAIDSKPNLIDITDQVKIQTKVSK